MSRHPDTVAKLTGLVRNVRDFVPTGPLSGIALPPGKPEALEADQAAFLEINEEFSYTPERPWNVKDWLERTKTLQTAVWDLQKWLWDEERKADKEAAKRDPFEALKQDLSDVTDQLEEFQGIVSRSYFTAENERLAIVEGSAEAESHTCWSRGGKRPAAVAACRTPAWTAILG